MSHSSRPDDFDAYWQQVCRELDDTPIAPEEQLVPLRSTDFCDCYAVRFTGIGPYRLFGYLSIPHGEGPFPAILIGPAYRSVVEPAIQGDSNEKRSRYVIFSTAGRGQRNADKPFAAQFPGLMTEGIDDPESYIFRGYIADWLRATDYLLTRPEVDQSRVLAIKPTGGLPLLAAALRPGITHVVAAPGYFYNARENVHEEVADYVRFHPDKRDQVERTLAYFDPLYFAENIRTQTLLWSNLQIAAPLTAAFAGDLEVRQSESSTYKDGMHQEQWLAEQFGFDEPILPLNWRS